MAKNKKKRKGKDKQLEEQKPPINHRLHFLQGRIYEAAGVASCIQYASDSMLRSSQGKPNITDAASALDVMLGGVAGEMEDIIEELGGAPVAGENYE